MNRSRCFLIAMTGVLWAGSAATGLAQCAPGGQPVFGSSIAESRALEEKRHNLCLGELQKKEREIFSINKREKFNCLPSDQECRDEADNEMRRQLAQLQADVDRENLTHRNFNDDIVFHFVSIDPNASIPSDQYTSDFLKGLSDQSDINAGEVANDLKEALTGPLGQALSGKAAGATVDVLQNLNGVLETLNQARENGAMTDAMKAQLTSNVGGLTKGWGDLMAALSDASKGEGGNALAGAIGPAAQVTNGLNDAWNTLQASQNYIDKAGAKPGQTGYQDGKAIGQALGALARAITQLRLAAAGRGG